MTSGTWRTVSKMALCALPLVLAACNSSTQGSTTLAENRLELENQNEVCHVKNIAANNSSQPHSLNIPWPCNFHKNKSGDVRIIRSGEYDYLLVESSKPSPENSRDCETHLRSIRAAGEQLEISQHQDKVTSCPPFQWDDMVFIALFD